jgi:Transposase DDE domain/Domain of unknown function (DUF4372)
MSKSTHFSTNSVFGQLISLIGDQIISNAVKSKKSDKYTKKFSTKDHLISMLFCVGAKCNSLREVSGAMLGLAGKTENFQLKHIPKKSTLSDANKNRSAEVFGEIYQSLLKKYSYILSDSRIKSVLKKQVKLFDSTTISLFKDILKCTGNKAKDGKSKGGLKVHTVINADEKVPDMVWFSSAATSDHKFLDKLKCDDNTIYVFDKGYNDYRAFEHFTKNGTGFVTRIKTNAVYSIVEKNEISEKNHSGIIEDVIIEVKLDRKKQGDKLRLRKVKFYDRTEKREFEFISNLFDLKADFIPALYKLRWQIELLFKQMKQNFPLKYFLGDNENAIMIQIYCVLIYNLLMSVVKKGLKRKWSFSNLVSFCKIHLFNFINLYKFLENPEKDWQIDHETIKQPTLFDQLSF